MQVRYTSGFSGCENFSFQYNWNSTRNTKNKNFLGFILQDITSRNRTKVRNCYFGDTLGAWEQMWNSVFFYDFVNF